VPEDKRGANGKPAPGAFVRIVDPETRAPLPPGQPGELLAGGYSLMAGLYKRERHETFLGEVLYPTGDMCKVDEDGWVTFVTRLSEMIKISGANVAPLEVESLLNAREAIRESAVVGVERDRRTELVAAVILHDGAPRRASAHCRAQGRAVVVQGAEAHRRDDRRRGAAHGHRQDPQAAAADPARRELIGVFRTLGQIVYIF
jgi:acyl-coenzyme A synthetase/AMP-(fatty) acid ligase